MSRERCPHCRVGNEIYRYMKRRYVFDVDLARSLVQDGREPVEMEPADVEYSVKYSRIYRQHLPHVKVQYPGIVSHVWYPNPDGTLVHGHVLIDGNHRAARSLQLGRPYFIQLLTEEESVRILLRSPLTRAPDLLCGC